MKAFKMPKARPSEHLMEEANPHGAINKDKACLHSQRLDKIMDVMANRVKEGNASTMRQAIINCKAAIMMVMPGMEDADPTIILAAVRDPFCLAIHPQTEENQQKLEDMMPLAEIPKGEDIAADIHNMEPLIDDQRKHISELFEDMEVAHEHLAHFCSALGILSRTLTSSQLLLLLKASLRPLVQLNIAPGLFEEPRLGQERMELPKEQHKQVKLTMTPIATSGRLSQERPNSMTRLLAAMMTFKILKRFRDGITQHELQQMYGVRPKQLALCIMGKKYMGGSDRKTFERKCRALGDDSIASSSKKPTTE